MKTKDGKTLPKRRRGYYYDLPDQPEGEGYPSVTTILKVLAKPELTYWIKQRVYRATADNPDISEGEACMADVEYMQKAGNEGSLTHDIVDGDFKGVEYTKESIMKTLEEQKYKGNLKHPINEAYGKVRAYLDAFENFTKDHKLKVKESEGTVYSHTHKYAGTFDGIFDINGENWLIDWKTSNGIYWDYRIQIIAYKKALEEMGKNVDRCVIVQLKNNGEYMMENVGETEENVDLFKAFQACKYLFLTKQIIK